MPSPLIEGLVLFGLAHYANPEFWVPEDNTHQYPQMLKESCLPLLKNIKIPGNTFQETTWSYWLLFDHSQGPLQAEAVVAWGGTYTSFPGTGIAESSVAATWELPAPSAWAAIVADPFCSSVEVLLFLLQWGLNWSWRRGWGRQTDRGRQQKTDIRFS